MLHNCVVAVVIALLRTTKAPFVVVEVVLLFMLLAAYSIICALLRADSDRSRDAFDGFFDRMYAFRLFHSKQEAAAGPRLLLAYESLGTRRTSLMLTPNACLVRSK
jgi:hypothetical protein